ncbi:ankyrin repeat-containing domain, PGG domain protein [Tanacetum coccineum]
MDILHYDASIQGNLSVLLSLLQQDPLILDKVTINRDDDMPLHCDSQIRFPLHLASSKGHVEIVRALVTANTDTCGAHDRDGRNRFILLWLKDGDHEFVNTKDGDGNTILLLDVAYNQIETINFLLLDTTINVNASNTDKDTPMDILSQGPKDTRDQQIIQSLIQAGAVDAKEESLFRQIPHNPKSKLALDLLFLISLNKIRRTMKTG